MQAVLHIELNAYSELGVTRLASAHRGLQLRAYGLCTTKAHLLISLKTGVPLGLALRACMYGWGSGISEVFYANEPKKSFRVFFVGGFVGCVWVLRSEEAPFLEHPGANLISYQNIRNAHSSEPTIVKRGFNVDSGSTVDPIWRFRKLYYHRSSLDLPKTLKNFDRAAIGTGKHNIWESLECHFHFGKLTCVNWIGKFMYKSRKYYKLNNENSGF